MAEIFQWWIVPNSLLALLFNGHKRDYGFFSLFFFKRVAMFVFSGTTGILQPLPVRPLTARSRQEVLHLLSFFIYTNSHGMIHWARAQQRSRSTVRHPLHSTLLLRFLRSRTLLLRFVYLGWCIYWNVSLMCCSIPFTCVSSSISLCLRVWLVLVHPLQIRRRRRRRRCGRRTECPPFHLKMDIPKRRRPKETLAQTTLKTPSQP